LGRAKLLRAVANGQPALGTAARMLIAGLDGERY